MTKAISRKSARLVKSAASHSPSSLQTEKQPTGGEPMETRPKPKETRPKPMETRAKRSSGEPPVCPSKRAKTNKPECPICCETYTKVKRPTITCPLASCDFQACKACVMRYLSEDTYDAAHCMKCKEPWLNIFVQSVCTKTFWKGPFRDHMQRLVMDRERNALPAAQAWVQHYNRYRSAAERREALVAEKREITRRKREIDRLLGTISTEAYRLGRDLDDGIRRMEARADGSFGYPSQPSKGNQELKEPEEVIATMGCPIESCRGFIGKRSQCGVCEVFVCAKCRQVKKAYQDDEHVCKAEDLASVAFLKRDSKPCPSCAAPIHRISGCSHMWCTACHTAFCWNTLRILNAARTHNPHMAQWLMQNVGRLGDDARRRMGVNQADYQTLQRFRCLVSRDKACSILGQAWTLRNHFAHLIQRIRRPYTSDRTLRMARLAYLCGEIDEKGWEARVRRFDLGRQRADAKTHLYETYITGMDGINCRIATEGEAKIDPKAVLEALENLRTFFNSSWAAARSVGDLGASPKLWQISPEFLWPI